MFTDALDNGSLLLKYLWLKIVFGLIMHLDLKLVLMLKKKYSLDKEKKGLEERVCGMEVKPEGSKPQLDSEPSPGVS